MKKLLACFLLLFIVSNVASEVEIGLSGGYGFPVAGHSDDFFLPYSEYSVNYDSSDNSTYSDYKDINPSFGKGLKIGLDVSIFFNDNVGLFIGTGFSTLSKYSATTKESYADAGSNGYETSEEIEEISGSFLPINIGLKVKGSGKVAPYLVVAPGLYLPLGFTAKYDYKIDGESMGGTDDVKIKYAPGFGVKSALGLKVNFTDNIGIKFECVPTLASARVKEAEYTEEGETYKAIFEKNTGELTEDTDTEEYYHGGPVHAFSSVDANIGFVVSF